MAYEIQRKQRIKDQLVLKDETGEVVHILDVDLDADTIAGRYTRAVNNVIRAEQILSSKDPAPEMLEQYGNAITDLLGLIFGEENAACILEFYENRYSEMLNGILPYIQDVIAPKIEESSKARVEQLKSRFNREQQRKYGLK